MSELGPDYLPEMREALSRFCNEIRSFHTAQGLDPAPGSPAVNEHATAPLIESGGEHVTAFVKMITKPTEPGDQVLARLRS